MLLSLPLATDLLQLFFWFSFFLGGFQSRACLVTFVVDFQRVCLPYPGSFSFFISCLMHPWSDLVLCGHILPFIFENVSQTFVYECLELSSCCLGYSPCLRAIEQHAFHIGVEGLKIQILFLVEKGGVFHTVFKMMNACLVFLILLWTSSSVPPFFIATLPRHIYFLSSAYLPLIHFILFSGLSSLLPVSIGWSSFASVCVKVIVGRCHLQSLGHPIV